MHLFAFTARLAFVAGLALAACTGSSSGITTVSCPTDSTLTYENFGSAFVADNCLSCHDTQRPQFTTQAEILAEKTAILDEAVYSTDMPENANMTTDERTLLGEWLACGAP
jgi:uncharacterized membrane protein